ncbi:hypothetical protein D3C73_1367710 [compost metagenome]
MFHRLAFEFYPATQHLALRLPQRPQLIVERRHQVEGGPLGMRLQVLHLHADSHATHATHGAKDTNTIAQMNQPQQRKGKRLVREQLHLQRKRQDVWISRRQ